MGHQAILGNQNVQIQGAEGSLIQVTYNQAVRTVPLEPAVVPVTSSSPSPARLVRAHAGVFPYVDRGGFLAELETWTDIQAPFAGMVVGGRGGSGKTRLAVEICEKLQEQRWLCGFLARIADQSMLDALVQAPTARLVVVDYAESRVEQLQVLLPLLKADATMERPVRVLLLVRADPSQARDWPARLRNQIDSLDAVLDECSVRILEEAPLGSHDRTTLFQAAAAAFAQRIGSEAKIEGPPDLSAETFSSPLMIVIAAYLAVNGEKEPSESTVDLLDEILAHERRYWRQSLDDLEIDDVLLERLVALATLVSVDYEEQAAQALSLLPDLSDASRERRNRLARWLRAQYPGPRWWNPLEPDLLGEHLVADCFVELGEVLREILGADRPDDLTRPLEVLARAAGDHPDFEAVLRPVLASSLAHLCDMASRQAVTTQDRSLLYGSAVTVASALSSVLEVVKVNDDALTSGLASVPSEYNLLLNELSMVITRQQVARRRTSTSSETSRRRLAIALNNYSNHLDNLGRSEEALNAIEESVDIYHDLSTTQPALRPYLATALNNLSSILGRAARPEAALEASEESVRLRREADAAGQSLEVDAVASGLNNLANCLWLLTRYEEALNAIQEGVEIYRRLVAEHPELEIRLARSLNNLSNCLGQANRHEEALAAIEESIAIRRPLATAQPAAFAAGLAGALNNCGGCLLELERGEEALEPLQESANLFRSLAAANPRAHSEELTLTIGNLYQCLKSLGKKEEADAVLDELERLGSTGRADLSISTG